MVFAYSYSYLSLSALALALALPAWLLLRRTPAPPAVTTDDSSSLKTIMQPPRTDLAPPKEDPITLADLAQYDGTDPSRPIYVAIKGTVFDVTHKADVYGPEKSYHIFAGKDGSRGLGKSSLKPEDAVADYSVLSDDERKVLDDWHAFFSKRYNIVGRVVDVPEEEAVRAPAPA